MSFELFIGGRYLKTKQKQTFIFLITLLSIIGVTVGVMALIIVIAVMSGLESDLKSRILKITPHIMLERNGPFVDYQQVIQQLQNMEGIETAMAFVDGSVMFRSSTRVAGGLVRGVVPASAVNVYKQFPVQLLEKNAMNPSGSEIDVNSKVILGKELAGNLGVIKGDLIYIITPRGTLSPIGHIPAMKRFKVIDTFSTGIYDYDGSLALIHLDEAQKLFRMGTGITGIDIRVRDIYRANKIAEKIKMLLGPAFRVNHWMQMNRNLFSALKLEKIAMFIILALIVLVAAFNIAGTLMMMVMEKTKDIAILKAIGASNKSIGEIFIYKGMAIGIIGVLLGTSAGISLCELLRYYKFIELPDNVYYITTLPVQLEGLHVFIIGTAALLICFLATLYPARQASRLNPVEAIRYG